MGCSSKRVFTDEQHRQCMANMSDIDYGYAKKMCACVKKGYESGKNYGSVVDITVNCSADAIINEYENYIQNAY